MSAKPTGGPHTPAADDRISPARIAEAVGRVLDKDPAEVRPVLEALAEGLHPVYLARFRPDRAPEAEPRDIETMARVAADLARVELRRAAILGELRRAGFEGPRMEALVEASTTAAEFDDLRAALRRKRRGAARTAAAAGLVGLADVIWEAGATVRPPKRVRRKKTPASPAAAPTGRTSGAGAEVASLEKAPPRAGSEEAGGLPGPAEALPEAVTASDAGTPDGTVRPGTRDAPSPGVAGASPADGFDRAASPASPASSSPDVPAGPPGGGGEREAGPSPSPSSSEAAATSDAGTPDRTENPASPGASVAEETASSPDGGRGREGTLAPRRLLGGGGPTGSGAVARPLSEVAARFVRGEVADVEAALAGARAICADDLARVPELRRRLREVLWAEGALHVSVRPEPEEAHPVAPPGPAKAGPVPNGDPAPDPATDAGASASDVPSLAGAPAGENAANDSADAGAASARAPEPAPSSEASGGAAGASAGEPTGASGNGDGGPAGVQRDAASSPAPGAAGPGPGPAKAGRSKPSRKADRRASKKAKARRKARLDALRSQGLLERALPVADLDAAKVLTIWHGVRTGLLHVEVPLPHEALLDAGCNCLGIDPSSEHGAVLYRALAEALSGELGRALAAGLRRDLKDRADDEVIGQLAAALAPLLLAPAQGAAPVLGAVPGFTHGCRLVVLDAEGSPVAEDVIHPLPPKLQGPQAAATVTELIDAHGVRAIAVAGGRGGRALLRFLRDTVRGRDAEARVPVVEVPEDAAVLYAGSKVGRAEFPDRDAAYRRAVSIGRRLQDPLVELAKVDLRHLGLGPHQHDVDPHRLQEALDESFVTCLHRAGLPLNRAPAHLLERLTGLGHALAGAVVAHRERHGPFRTRAGLLDVPGVPGRAFLLAAGFLWLESGEHPLDRTFVHPEWYGLVAEMARVAGFPLADVVGVPERVDAVAAVAEAFLGRPSASGERLGPKTLARLLGELRSPRAQGRPALADVYFEPPPRTFDQVRAGEELEGVVTHVAAFGAFVDVGLPVDALLHVREFADTFVEDPFTHLAVGERVRVRVVSIDPKRERVAVSRRSPRSPRKTRRGAGKPRRARGEEARGRGEDRPRKGRARGHGRKKARRPRQDEGMTLSFRMDLGHLLGHFGSDDEDT